MEEAFAHKSRQWQEWRDNLDKVSQPDAALRIAELILEEAGHASGWPAPLKLFEGVRGRSQANGSHRSTASRVQLCDFHIHTNYSDGRLTLPEVIDFYGRRGFDCICVTDHVADPRRLIGKFSELLNFTIACDQLDEYFDMLERERRRAWRKYDMLVMAGLEFNKEGFTKKTSGHLLGIDLKAPIAPSLGFVEIVAQIHSQGGLAVAAHPHVMKSEWGKNTLFLWENQEVFAPIIDAWEIANRNNIFTPIGLKRFAFLANSDFHKPKHIYSWKTTPPLRERPRGDQGLHPPQRARLPDALPRRHERRGPARRAPPCRTACARGVAAQAGAAGCSGVTHGRRTSCQPSPRSSEQAAISPRGDGRRCRRQAHLSRPE